MSQECYSSAAQPQMYFEKKRKQANQRGYKVYGSIYNDILENAKLQGHKIGQ